MHYYLITTPRMLCESTFVKNWKTHLILAPFLYDNEEACASIKAMIDEGAQVILDNGAYEGFTCPPDKYLDLVKKLNPWCVVLPDSVGTSRLVSRDLGLEFLMLLQKINFENRIMYVPQGLSKEEVLEEFAWSLVYNPNWIHGLGKCYLHWGTKEKDRVQFLKDVAAEPLFHRSEFHMLGARQIPTKEFAAYSNVIGIDTFKPMKRACSPHTYELSASSYTAPLSHTSQ